jgi:conjugative transfer signal peptidase TraF
MKKTVIFIIAFFSFIFIGIAYFMYSNNYYINLTNSYPIGIYKSLKDNSKFNKDDLVIFCPPDNEIFKNAKELGYLKNGFCPGGYIKMMKKIAAVPGDKIQIANYVYVNNVKQVNSQVFYEDSKGNKLPKINKSFVLENDEYLLLSDYAIRSFDGRYFGPIKKNRIEKKMKAILIF